MRRRLAAMLLVMAAVFAVPAAPSGAQAESFDELRAEFGYTEGHAAVMRLYRAFFEREPDVGGAEYWLLQYDLGSTLDDIAWAFAASAEFTARYGADLDNAQFLSIVYGNVLGRTPDQEGFDYWLGEMNGGLARPEVVRWVTANPEFIQRFPYSPVGPDLSVELLRTDQLPSGFAPTAEARRAPHPLIDGCNNILGTGRMALGSFFAHQGAGDLLVHQVLDMGTADNAAAFVAAVDNAARVCPAPTDNLGRPMTVAEPFFAPVGQGGLTLVWRDPDGFPHTNVFWYHGSMMYAYEYVGNLLDGTAQQAIIEAADSNRIAAAAVVHGRSADHWSDALSSLDGDALAVGAPRAGMGS